MAVRVFWAFEIKQNLFWRNKYLTTKLFSLIFCENKPFEFFFALAGLAAAVVVAVVAAAVVAAVAAAFTNQSFVDSLTLRPFLFFSQSGKIKKDLYFYESNSNIFFQFHKKSIFCAHFYDRKMSRTSEFFWILATFAASTEKKSWKR